jgi:predicted translin family RNA/ssDNA-binding protein
MDRLTETAGEALEILHNLEVRRERTIRCSRDIIRETKKMIHAIHVAEDPSVYKENLRRFVSEIDATDDADDALASISETNLRRFSL